MAKGDAFWAAAARKDALQSAEAAGQVADSMEVRKALMDRVHTGEITLEQAQAELANIKRNAKRNGKVTRNQAYTGR
jgi:polyhydroxyalkanoate synthesis regulator phasin